MFGIEVDIESDPDSVFELWPENLEAFQMFVRCGTQWRVSAGGIVGLDYTALFQLMEMYDIKDRKDCFEGVQIMEAAALAKINGAGK